MRHLLPKTLAAAIAIAMPITAQAAVRITEFMYQGFGGGDREFVELTNIGNSTIDITGWTYNDNNPNDPVVFGDFFGVLAANESIILTELSANSFRTNWGLSNSVRIFSIGGNSNLNSTDTINIYNSVAQNTLMDTVLIAGSTSGISRNRPVGVDGMIVNTQFINSAVGDAYGSVYAGAAQASDLGNPGRFPVVTAAAVPEPASWALMIGGFALLGATVRRTRKVSFA